MTSCNGYGKCFTPVNIRNPMLYERKPCNNQCKLIACPRQCGCRDPEWMLSNHNGLCYECNTYGFCIPNLELDSTEDLSEESYNNDNETQSLRSRKGYCYRFLSMFRR